MNDTENNIADIVAKHKKEKPQETKEAKEKDEELKHNDPVDDLTQTLLFKIQEEKDDAKHSKDNNALLNKVYSQLVKVFFEGRRFWFWLALYIVCFFVADKDFFQCFEIKQVAFLYYSAEKIFTILSAIMMILLSFPTAKGIRRLFRAMIERISKKHT